MQSATHGSEESQDALKQLIAKTRPWPVRWLVRLWRSIRTVWWTSLAVWITTLPLVVYRFHLVTPVALLINPLVWLPIAAALFSGFGVLLLGPCVPALGDVFGWFCDVNLAAIELCLQLGLAVPAGHFWWPAPPAWWVVASYVIPGGMIAVPRLQPSRVWCLALTAGWFVLGLIAAIAPSYAWFAGGTRSLTCTFVSVGHGASVLIESPAGLKLLYDAGRQGTPGAAVRAVSGVLWSRGIWRLDAVILSHADADHYNALPELLDRFRVGTVYVSDVMFRDPSPALEALQAAIRRSQVPLRTIAAGDRLPYRGAEPISVLHPPRAGVGGEDNANSVTLRIDSNGRTILLPGDLEGAGMESLIRMPPLNCDVLMAPHHGSTHSNPKAIVAWASPKWVVISDSAPRAQGPTRSAYIPLGVHVFHTAENGAVRVSLDAKRIHIGGWLDAPW
jgi:competence protein ComEC